MKNIEEQTWMVTFWVFLLIILIAIPIGWYFPAAISEADIQKKKKAQKQYLQNKADRVVNNIQYIQDPQTDICYAYYLDIGASGSNSSTVVPCEKIPPELLTRGNTYKK